MSEVTYLPHRQLRKSIDNGLCVALVLSAA